MHIENVPNDLRFNDLNVHFVHYSYSSLYVNCRIKVGWSLLNFTSPYGYKFPVTKWRLQRDFESSPSAILQHVLNLMKHS